MVREIAEALPEGDPRRVVVIGAKGKAKADVLESAGHVDQALWIACKARVAHAPCTHYRGARYGSHTTPEICLKSE